MKVFVVLLVLAAGYAYLLMHVTGTVLTQVQHINASYQYVANHANTIASGQH